MFGSKCNICLVIVLVSLYSVQAFSQQINYSDSITEHNSRKVNLMPRLNYSVGSTFTIIPHLGTVTGFTLSPFLSVPLSAKWSVDGGIIAGRYYSSLRNLNSEGNILEASGELSIYSSASYHVNSELTVYGTAIKHIIGTSPFSLLPKSSYAIGSTYKFGNFSIGVTVQTSTWNGISSNLPFNGTQGFYLPY
jgi:hypothetical protein